MSDKNIDKDTKKFLDNMGNRLKLAKENGCKLLDCKTIDNNIKLRLENIKLRKDLETYKKIADEIENMFGEEFTKLGPYEKDNSTPEKERIAGGINILNKLRKRLDWARKEVEKDE